MGFLRSVLYGPRHIQAATTPAGGPGPLSDYWYGPVPSSASASLSGIAVTPDSALKVSAVYACVRIIAESVAGLPLNVYARMPDGSRVEAFDHPLYDVLRTSPNARQTAFTFKCQMMANLLLRGNAYARILPGPRGPVDQLVPLANDYVTPPRRLSDPNVYMVRDEQTNIETPVHGEDILHLMGLSINGVSGLSVIGYARESLGITLAAEQYASRVFSQDGTPRGVLTHPGELSKEAQERLQESWAESHAGLQNAHKPAILEEGLKFENIAMTAEDAQMLASREFQVIDVARWFGVPLHMIQETAKATSWGTGLSELGTVFVLYCLMPWLNRWEDTCKKDLITGRSYYAKFSLDAYLRGKATERWAVYTQARNAGVYSVNDILRMEDMNPIGPEGDIRLQPANFTPLGTPVADPTNAEAERE